jgi:hypothetical protein
VAFLWAITVNFAGMQANADQLPQPPDSLAIQKQRVEVASELNS